MKTAGPLGLLLLLSGVVVAAALDVRPGGAARFRDLERFAGRDLGALGPEDRARLDARLDEMGIGVWSGTRAWRQELPGRILPGVFAPSPTARPLVTGFHLMAPLSIQAFPGVVVVVSEGPVILYSGADQDIGFHVVRPSGRVTATGPLEVTEGFGLRPVRLPPDRLGVPAFLVRFRGLRTDGRLVFALRPDDRFAVVRAEDAEGRFVRVFYADRLRRNGPPPADRTEDEWADLLGSDDRVDRLEALVFLAGVHLAPGVRFGLHPEDEKTARTWWRLGNRPDVEARLRVLRDSPDPWEREAAGAALAPEMHPAGR